MYRGSWFVGKFPRFTMVANDGVTVVTAGVMLALVVG